MSISRKVRITEVLLLGVLLFISGCASSQKPRLSVDTQAGALSHFSLGLLAESGGDSAAALDHLKAAIRLDPKEEKLYAPAVAIALKLGQTNDAVRLACELVKRHPDSADPQLLLARIYTLTGKPELAEPLFRKALADSPDDPEAPIFLARFYLSQNRRAEALEAIRTAVKTRSRNAEMLYLLGTLCVDSARDMGNTPQAKAAIEEGIGFLQQSLEIAPENPLRWQQLSFAHLSVNQPDKALETLEKARRYAPSDLMLARQLFDLIIQNRNYDQALAIYDRLATETGTEPAAWLQYLAEKIPEEARVRLTEHLEMQIHEQPQSPVFYYSQLGALYIGARKNQEAEAVLTKALEHYPDDNRLRTVLGYLYLQQERYDEAYAGLDRVRTESPEAEWASNPFFLFNFLVAAQKSSHTEQAAETLAKIYTGNPDVLNQYMQSLLTGKTPVSTENTIKLLSDFNKLSPETAEALYYLMALQAEQKKYSEAIETAKQLEALVQKTGHTDLLTGQFYYQYAALYERTGQLDAAEKLFQKCIELSEDRLAAAAQNYIAYMWAERGEKLDMGLKLVQKALKVDPENGAFLDTLGWIYYMQGRYPAALKELQKARTVMDDDPSIWEHLGDTYLKLGDSSAAIAHWKKALELDPESKRLVERLEANGVNSAGVQKSADSPADTTPRP